MQRKKYGSGMELRSIELREYENGNMEFMCMYMYYLELCLKPGRVWCLKLVKQFNLFLQIVDLYISLTTCN